MNFLFGKKQTVQAFAVTLENGREIANREIKNSSTIESIKTNLCLISPRTRAAARNQEWFHHAGHDKAVLSRD